MIRRRSNLAWVRTLLGFVSLAALALTLVGLVPPAAAGVRDRWRAGRASLASNELEARRTTFGRPWADGIESIRAVVPERAPYLLVCDGIGIVYMAAYDLAPRKPLLLVPGMPSIESVRDAVRGRRLPLPPWTVVIKRGEPAPRLVATASLFGPPSS